MTTHLTLQELEKGLPEILRSPKNPGRLEAIVIRPKSKERVSLSECELSAESGTHGDRWADGCWMKLPDGNPHPDVQIAITNSRVIDLVAQARDRWELAGDNLYVDMDLSDENLPLGQRLSIGPVTLEITGVPHNGCQWYGERYGVEALKFVNSPEGKKHHLRGIYAKVIEAGVVSVGDEIRKI
jgi:hypothetical protein